MTDTGKSRGLCWLAGVLYGMALQYCQGQVDDLPANAVALC